METLRKPIKISFKVFESKHAKDVEEEHNEEATTNRISSNRVVENIATRQPVDNLQLFHFLSLELTQVRNRRKEIAKEKNKLETEDHNLAMKEFNVQQLLGIISSQVHVVSKASTFGWQNSF